MQFAVDIGDFPKHLKHGDSFIMAEMIPDRPGKAINFRDGIDRPHRGIDEKLRLVALQLKPRLQDCRDMRALRGVKRAVEPRRLDHQRSGRQLKLIVRMRAVRGIGATPPLQEKFFDFRKHDGDIIHCRGHVTSFCMVVLRL